MKGRICLCRNCGAAYEEHKSRADWKGYCSQKCVHMMAKLLGFRQTARKTGSGPVKTEYYYLKQAEELGSVYVTDDKGNPIHA